ncbi:hypothetical protein D3C76_1474830 [compost metagenome]
MIVSLDDTGVIVRFWTFCGGSMTCTRSYHSTMFEKDTGSHTSPLLDRSIRKNRSVLSGVISTLIVCEKADLLPSVSIAWMR